jgi:hypothetical protein
VPLKLYTSLLPLAKGFCVASLQSTAPYQLYEFALCLGRKLKSSGTGPRSISESLTQSCAPSARSVQVLGYRRVSLF